MFHWKSVWNGSIRIYILIVLFSSDPRDAKYEQIHGPMDRRLGCKFTKLFEESQQRAEAQACTGLLVNHSYGN